MCWQATKGGNKGVFKGNMRAALNGKRQGKMGRRNKGSYSWTIGSPPALRARSAILFRRIDSVPSIRMAKHFRVRKSLCDIAKCPMHTPLIMDTIPRLTLMGSDRLVLFCQQSHAARFRKLEIRGNRMKRVDR